MGEIINLSDRKKEPTKRISGEHAGQRYTCVFDPHAPAHERWVWYVDYVQTYRYVGSAPSSDKAAADARRRIHALNKREDDASGA